MAGWDVAVVTSGTSGIGLAIAEARLATGSTRFAIGRALMGAPDAAPQ
jgi:NAD(P)-dependent dehydrogenase (short-subunit alcohol dehydrogenase family)